MKKEPVYPEIGMGATIPSGSDSYPYTVIALAPSGRRMTISARTTVVRLRKASRIRIPAMNVGAFAKRRCARMGSGKLWARAGKSSIWERAGITATRAFRRNTLFDQKTQKTLDTISFVRCPLCGSWFLKRGVPGTTVKTIKKHMASSHKEAKLWQ